MGKITKTVQTKHKETMSSWLNKYMHTTATAPLPLLPQHLDEFPITKWPMPRGDLYHWIPLLNRFDNILESFNKTYHLNEGPQTRPFACDLLLGREVRVEEYGSDEWDQIKLATLGYKEDGDAQLVKAILNFTKRLLAHCGNRSIYSSSCHLNDLLQSTDLSVVHATLEVGLQLAQRYQASVKRMTSPNRHFSTALLANHYNIDVDRVNQIAQPFVKTPIMSLTDAASHGTPASMGKGKEKEKEKEKAQSPRPPASAANTPSMIGNDLRLFVSGDNTSESRFKGWGDLKVVYYPKTEDEDAVPQPTLDRPDTTVPGTPTPLRRSSTLGTQPTTPRSARAIHSADDTPSSAYRTPAVNPDVPSGSSQRSLEIPQSVVAATPIYTLLKRTPEDMSGKSKYEVLNRSRICKAMLDGPDARQQALAVRLLAIANLSFIHPESVFLDQVVKQDNDEPRRYHLVYQLVELIHPSTTGQAAAPRWLQTIILSLLDGLAGYHAKHQDVLSALNATVNHGVLLYVIRKAVAEMKEDPEQLGQQAVEVEDWRISLFQFAQNLAINGRVGAELISAGFIDVLVDIIKMRNSVAERWHNLAVYYVDNLVSSFGTPAFTAFNNATGFDSVAELLIYATSTARSLAQAGQGTKPELHSSVVDYEIPFYQQQTIKWVLKLVHHIMTPNSFSSGGNTERLLRKLVDDSKFLGSLRAIMENPKSFGSVVWTNTISLLTDFINQDPTSFAAISEAGMVKSLLESLTGRSISTDAERREDQPANEDNSMSLEPDERPHPPTAEMLRAPRPGPLACGVLASSEAIEQIIPVITAISLNHAGMRLVVSSRVLESIFEVFESPEHVRLMQASHELPYNLGLTVDELGRHHPSLRPTIANAVIDMLARVLYLGRSKADSDGWGAKLLVTNSNGKVVPADASLLRETGPLSNTDGEIATSEDVEMQDATQASKPDTSSRPTIVNASKQSEGFMPYVTVLAHFLTTYGSNSQLKDLLLQNGGINYLLDILELPSLPHDYANTSALKTLQTVIASYVSSNSIIGMPAVLNRLRDAIGVLKPMVSKIGPGAFFAQFVEPGSVLAGSDESGRDFTQEAIKGTRMVKALLNVQTLLKIVERSLPTSRQATSLPNVFDHLVRTVESLGPLFRAALQEEISLVGLVPQHWKFKSDIAAENRDYLLLQLLGEKPVDFTTDPSRQDRPTAEEQATAQYQNYKLLRTLLHHFKPNAYSFLQNLGKNLMLRRERDTFVRAKHMQLADAVAETIIEQLKPFVDEATTVVSLRICTVMVHVVYQVLIDPSHRRDTEGPGPHIMLPVLDAFKQRRGIEMLNKLAKTFANELTKTRSETEDPSTVKVGTAGLQKILDLYSVILASKNISQSASLLISPRQTSSRPQGEHVQSISQFIVETRFAALPVIAELWQSQLVEMASDDVVSKVVDNVKAICQADNEDLASSRSEPLNLLPMFKRDKAKFPWQLYTGILARLTPQYPEDLAREAVYRAIGQEESAATYCRMHHKGLAGPRNPVPSEDAFDVRPPTQNGVGNEDIGPSHGADVADPMVVDAASVPELADVSRSAAGQDPPAEESLDEESSFSAAASEPEASSAVQDQNGSVPRINKDDLDEAREKIRSDLVERCLDVIRAHPDSVYEVSELINVSLAIDGVNSANAREEVGETLVNALMSFEFDDEEKKAHGRSIAAYAHCLSLLLHSSDRFFQATVKSLGNNVSTYLNFLTVPPGNSNDELPPWIPHILLIFEMLLAEDAQPASAKWTAPRNENETLQTVVLQPKEPVVQKEQRMKVLESVLEILPRIGKDENLAVAVLRILVVLTRYRSLARIVGEKRNLARLFVMAKQLSGLGSSRLKGSAIFGNIMIVLRHIIEDDETVRQLMRSEIKKLFEQTPHRSRTIDITGYTRSLSHIALRSPELFIDVTNELVKLARFVPLQDSGVPSGVVGRGLILMLKETPAEKPAEPSGDALSLAPAENQLVEPAVQTLTEELTISDVKPTTESADKETTDATKTSPAETRRPVVENPDGMVHFLLCELLNYREVVDKEPAETTKDPIASNGTTSDMTPGPANGEVSTSDHPTTAENKDKKTAKLTFKTDEHPIFVYRCFLLNCLAELLQSYTRTKMEFINFKRSAPMFANTPVKPRSGVLNYLLQDLLCISTLSSQQDSIAAKKKAATSEQARQVLVSLVAKTSEKLIDRSRDHFDYEGDSDLLFVRKWVLDMILRAYKDATASHESFDVRYAKLLSLADLLLSMIGDKDRDVTGSRVSDASTNRSHMQLRRLMYEKGFLPALTASVAEIDLTFPDVKRTIKSILRVLQTMTSTAIQLSHANLLPSGPQDSLEDEIASVSSVSDVDDEREDTPDLYRNSSLGMLEAGREDDFDEDSDDDEDEEMEYEEDFPEELDYGDEMSQDGEEDVSDEDDELDEMGDIEGLPGHPVGVEVIMDDDDDDEDEEDEDEDMDDDDDEEPSDDENEDGDEDLDIDDIEDRVEIMDEAGNPLGDDGDDGWESETDEEEDADEVGHAHDYDDGVQDLDELADLGGANAMQELQELMEHEMDHPHILGEEGFGFNGHLDDEDEDEDGDDQDDLDEEYIYDFHPRPGDDIALPPAMPSGLGWDALVVERGPPRRHRPGFPAGPFMVQGGADDPLSADFRNFYSRNGRSSGPVTNPEDGLNPLLRRGPAATPPPPRLPRGGLHGFLDNPINVIETLMARLPAGIPPRDLHFQIRSPGGPTLEFDPHAGLRPSRTDARSDGLQDPQKAVAFTPGSTEQRWVEEARVVFGHAHAEKAARLNVSIWANLTPEAAARQRVATAEAERLRKEEQERMKRVEEDRKAREAKEAEEKAAREKAEAEERERERLEREAAEAAQAAEAAARAAELEAQRAEGSEDAAPQPMDGVESTETAPLADPEPAAATQPRVFTSIRDQQVDITDLGIDADYLAALPDEFREEVIAQTLTARRAEAREARAAAENPTGAQQGEVYQEFLMALPEDIRHEIEQTERHEQRRIDRENARRAQAANGQAADMDPASILATLPANIREEVLMEQGHELMDQLPPEMAAQARALGQRMRGMMPRAGEAARNVAEPAAGTENKVQRRAVVQMLDKAGVATLLRLMFINQQPSIRTQLFRVIGDISDNRQNRVEVIGSLLQILQFGSTDMEAVERSFSALSLRAKQPKDKEKEKDKDMRTPQSLKRTFTTIGAGSNMQQNSEISPLLVVQQCLDLLVELSGRNPHVAQIFLAEQDPIAASLKQFHKGKGKAKDLKVHKYPINSLLHLLDRDLIMESSSVMQLLVDLLNKLTLPLQHIERRRKEAEEAAKKAVEQAPSDNATNATESPSDPAVDAEPATESASRPAESKDAQSSEQKKVRHMPPPYIPAENLKLVVKIFVARECSSKTFQNTISTIKNLSNIPDAKQVFGKELVKQAQGLSKNIVSDLDELLPHIEKAESGTEIQGLALAKFSPGASEQNKLLRVLTALDHLFETKKDGARDAHDIAAADEKSSLLMSLYHNETFNLMWEKLSSCLSAIRQRDNMINVATILLPLIESLMVVCKNTTLDSQAQSGQASKELVLTSPPPEDAVAGLFFNFTNDHRRVLNELVRQNNKLMSGTFSLLVKNSNMLDFENKRNYFHRTVHSKNTGHARPSYPSLSLSIRRKHVFHDSYRVLAHKSDDEIKYGKLNVRFHGEDGVDAGGVSREWFQVLTRDMFNPNYALFIPVSSDKTTFHPNKSSHINDEHLRFFNFIGRVIGKAVYEGKLLDCYFSRAMYKRILGKRVSVKDMESHDPDYYKSLVWMLENDITNVSFETFSVEEDEFGVTKIHDLIPNGRTVEVTNENKHEFVRLVVEFKLLTSVKEQMDSFLTGFHGIIPAELISIFNEQELELLISGVPDIDVNDWKSNTEYHQYTAASQQIQWFWRAVRSFDKEERAKLMQFVTGTSKPPLNGFKELEGMNGATRFNIHRDYGNKDRLPSSHTCFNQLDLPEYDTYDTLRSQVLKAITQGSDYFGFA
ncbi:unnamed protein product [Discula destructiva]